jgi:hypothetical protein
VITAAVVTGAVIGLGEMAFGSGVHLQWQAVLRRDVSTWGWLLLNASIAAPWMRAFGEAPAFAHIEHTAVMAYGALGSAAVIAGVTAWQARRSAEVDLAWSVLWTAALLISPIGWTYYLWFAAGPLGATLIVIWQTRVAWRQPLLVLAACFVLPLPTLFMGQPSVTASLTVGSMFTWALMALWIAAASDGRLVRRQSRPAPSRYEAQPILATIGSGTNGR